MGITHAFTSAVDDGGDATLVRPSNWNAAHVDDLVLYGSLDPSAGGGVVAKVGALYCRDNGSDVGTLFQKTGAANTAWTQVGAATVAATTLITGQVNISNVHAVIVAQRATRIRVVLINRMARAVFVGIDGVAASDGAQVDPGASITLETSAAVYGITSAASGATEYVHYIEEYS